jgi:hypothetical protein
MNKIYELIVFWIFLYRKKSNVYFWIMWYVFFALIICVFIKTFTKFSKKGEDQLTNYLKNIFVWKS